MKLRDELLFTANFRGFLFYQRLSASNKKALVGTNQRFFECRRKGIEPSFPSGNTILSRARLPIPLLSPSYYSTVYIVYRNA